MIIDRSSDVVVSLTSYGERVKNVYLTIESIARGDLLPKRVILWLDDERWINNLPIELKRLKERGLEILKSPNFKPHTKYFPFVRYCAIDAPLVTADDDILYPRYWLKKLVEEHKKTSNEVVAFRAHRVALNSNIIAPYNSWNLSLEKDASFLNFATGVYGVIYPIKMLNVLKERGDKFLQLCPQADDVWLHVNAIRGGFRIRQIGDGVLFPEIINSQKIALHKSNIAQGGNDLQIAQTYTASDIETLTKELQ